jgi:hypothetical protein
MYKSISFLAVLAAIVASAVMASTASANGSTSQVGQAVCGPFPGTGDPGPVCNEEPNGIHDWGGLTNGQPGQEGESSVEDNIPSDPDEPTTPTPPGKKGSYHCNNLLYVGPPSPVATWDGTSYYTLGHLYVLGLTLGPDSSPGNTNYNANYDTDCAPETDTGDDGDRRTCASLYDNGDTESCGDPSEGGRGPSIVVLRAVGYLNVLGNPALATPGCTHTTANGDRNPCDESAGYVGVGRNGPDAGACGDGPGDVLRGPNDADNPGDTCTYPPANGN